MIDILQPPKAFSVHDVPSPESGSAQLLATTPLELAPRGAWPQGSLRRQPWASLQNTVGVPDQKTCRELGIGHIAMLQSQSVALGYRCSMLDARAFGAS